MLRRALLAAFSVLFLAVAAHAAPIDDGMSDLLGDSFPQTAKAVGEIAASGSPQSSAILDAIAHGRALIDAANHRIVLKTDKGDLVDAKTGAVIAGLDESAL